VSLPTVAIGMIAVAELLCTSLWFSANGAAAELLRGWGLPPTSVGTLTSAVQGGFIFGTLAFALSALADRVPASRIFFFSGLLGALANALFAFGNFGFGPSLVLRFVDGVALAGIYPLGMKLVVGWTRGGTAGTLALLVGMLVLGTALPHGLRAWAPALDWQWTVAAASLLSVIGAMLVLLTGDGPQAMLDIGGARSSWGSVLQAFRVPAFRAAAFGYFGHMWELYAFWTLVPYLVAPLVQGSLAAASFGVIAAGFAGSLAAGRLARRYGSARVAAVALAASGMMCLLYPCTDTWPAGVRLALLVFWGTAVVADSAQFSSLSSQACPAHLIGSALAAQNAIGFAISICSISLVTQLFGTSGETAVVCLAVGPALGLLAMLLPGFPGIRQRFRCLNSTNSVQE
jgi:MFS family permease